MVLSLKYLCMYLTDLDLDFTRQTRQLTDTIATLRTDVNRLEMELKVGTQCNCK